MGRLIPLTLSCFVILLTGCRSAPHEMPAASEAPPPNTDRSRFALLTRDGAVAVRLGATLAELRNAYPMPDGAKELPQAAMPNGFQMIAWVQSGGTTEKPAETLIAYFRDGRLIEISHSIAPLTSGEATLWSRRYEESFGEPTLSRQPARTIRNYGREPDACRLKLETIRSGGDHRFTATLIDTEHVKAFQEALRAMRERKQK